MIYDLCDSYLGMALQYCALRNTIVSYWALVEHAACGEKHRHHRGYLLVLVLVHGVCGTFRPFLSLID